MLSANHECQTKHGKKRHAQCDRSHPGYSIRPATRDDFEEIMAIEKACFPGELAYSREQMRYLVFRANSETLVADAHGAVMGYVTALFRSNSRAAGIETIGVNPNHRGNGMGTGLLSAAEEAMSRRGTAIARLEVSSGNREAISMYSKAGYRVAGAIPNYYTYEHNGTRDALRMEKTVGRRIG